MALLDDPRERACAHVGRFLVPPAGVDRLPDPRVPLVTSTERSSSLTPSTVAGVSLSVGTTASAPVR